ncbi:hypothetical protein LO762_26315 [Actinocorallia sp. API 0066]|uniref:hypothetical protein n=1 Tax=Actinocorallia sp. API 0066 TaxID=2896846 RepID=UPI001E51CEE1|nr:hypothetical protein [Actinocorallia sp. API 0066]MCD0452669.1 hypothetical protein [Actinocorallia sp. API 0066]
MHHERKGSASDHGDRAEDWVTAKEPGTGGDSLLWLGTQVTEVETLLALALTAPTLLAERRALTELADAAERLALGARYAAMGDTFWHRTRVRALPRSRRARRRAASADRGAALILGWLNRSA